MDGVNIVPKNGPLTMAERSTRYRQNLKASNKYDAYKKKHAEDEKKRRSDLQNDLNRLSESARQAISARTAALNRERGRRFRERKRKEKGVNEITTRAKTKRLASAASKDTTQRSCDDSIDTESENLDEAHDTLTVSDVPLTAAEKCKRYRQNLKIKNKYDAFKKKHAEDEKQRRLALQNDLNRLSKPTRKAISARTAALNRERGRRFRERKRKERGVNEISSGTETKRPASEAVEDAIQRTFEIEAIDIKSESPDEAHDTPTVSETLLHTGRRFRERKRQENVGASSAATKSSTRAKTKRPESVALEDTIERTFKIGAIDTKRENPDGAHDTLTLSEVPLTAAEKCKRYRQNLKLKNKYDAFKKKHAEDEKKRRLALQNDLNRLRKPTRKGRKVISARTAALNRERGRRFRERKREQRGVNEISSETETKRPASEAVEDAVQRTFEIDAIDIKSESLDEVHDTLTVSEEDDEFGIFNIYDNKLDGNPPSEMKTKELAKRTSGIKNEPDCYR